MYAVMLLTALAAPGQMPDWCSYAWYGCDHGGYAHGYGSFRPAPKPAGGVVLPRGVNWVEATSELRKAFVEHPGLSRAVLGGIPAV